MVPSGGLTGGGCTGAIDTVTVELPGAAASADAVTMSCACGVLGSSASSNVCASSAAVNVWDADLGPGFAPSER